MKLKKFVVIYCYGLDWEIDYQKINDAWRELAKGISKKTHLVFFNIFSSPKTIFTVLKSKQERKKFVNFLTSWQSSALIFYPLALFPFQRFKIIQKINYKLMYFFLQWLAKFWSRKKKVIIWLTGPNTFLLGHLNQDNFFLYDCTDQHCNMTDKIADKKIKKQEREIIRKSSLTVVNSPSLYQEKVKYSSKVFQVPAGFPLKFFLNYKKESKSKELDNIPRPIIGYTGAISFRLDFSLLEKIIKRCSDFSFVFIGFILKSRIVPPHQNMDKKVNFSLCWKKLQNYQNFYFLGPKPRRLLPSFIDCFDVGFIPYDIKQEFNKMSNPIKVYEYLALGKPVVSTKISSLDKFSDNIYFINSLQEFQNSLKIILKNKVSFREKQAKVKIAQGNSINAKLETIEDYLIRF